MNCSQPRIPARVLAPFVAFAIGLTGLALIQDRPSAAVSVTEQAIVADASAVIEYDSPSVQTWTPDQEPEAPVTGQVCEEDQPCWDCETMGNLVCGSIDDTATAWAVWDEVGASRGLVDGGFRVDYMGSTENYPENLTPGDLPLQGSDYRWYVFHVTLDPNA